MVDRIAERILHLADSINEGITFSLSMVRGGEKIYINSYNSEEKARSAYKNLDWGKSWKPEIVKKDVRNGKIIDKSYL